ncbi:DUF6498-containing protein [Halorubrum tebenquichense]|uniref:Uncharacterized protein n=1 Tax=Halorubrum tebenquichense DSM 14210 TaxID=1227485 RepID=M0DHQ0_9EURY|nr:DUF6498-containing protein [Halorubrum tebenquichense]ELZ34257.1 hypothetical protein C472_13222 [Halorubrum tebenquichense DSM 14210]
MPSPGPFAWFRALARGRRPRALSVAVANLLPLVGVVALGWSAGALVLLYWFELGIASFWAIVRALFAGRPSEVERDGLIAGPLAERRTAIPVPGTDLRIWLSTLLVLPIFVPVLAGVWFMAGVVTVGVAVDGGLAPDALDSVAVAMLVIFATEGATTLVDYIYLGEYCEHSAQTAVRGVFFRALTIAVGGIVAAMLIGAATVGPDAELSAIDPGVAGLPLLLGIVCVKAAFDLVGLYRDGLTEVDESSALDLGLSYDPPSTGPIDGSVADPVRTVQQPRRARLAGALTTPLGHPGLWYLGALPALVAAIFAIGGDWATAAALLAVAVGAPLSLAALDHELRYGLVDYRAGDDALVAYDRLFDVPLWRVEPWDETDLRVKRGRLDRRLDTETVVIELRDGEHRIPGLADPEPILDVFDRRPDRPDE